MKEKFTTPPPAGVWPGRRIQVLGYLAGLEELAWPKPTAKVLYRGHIAEVRYTAGEAC